MYSIYFVSIQTDILNVLLPCSCKVSAISALIVLSSLAVMFLVYVFVRITVNR